MQTIVIAALVGVLVFGMAIGANAQTKEHRFPDLKREQMTYVQKRVYDAIAGVIGLVAVSGYYTLVSMVLNVAGAYLSE